MSDLISAGLKHPEFSKDTLLPIIRQVMHYSSVSIYRLSCFFVHSYLGTKLHKAFKTNTVLSEQQSWNCLLEAFAAASYSSQKSCFVIAYCCHCLFLVLGIKSRAASMLGAHCTTEFYPRPRVSS